MELRPHLRRFERSDPVVLAAWGLVVLPIVTATIRAVRDGWIPIGDNALVAIRARDVLGSHHPWLGTWSSASIDAGIDLNHPGPLLFESVAPSVHLFGGHVGVAIGVALVNIMAVTTVAVFGYRRGGRHTALAALAACAAVVYTMGSELLFDPWNPHIAIIACLALLMAVWGIAAGDRWAWPVAVALGSYCLQVHLGYAYLVPALLIVAIVVGVVMAGRPARSVTLPTRRTLTITIVVGVLLWAQPLWEQLTGDGEGNLSRLLRARGAGGAGIGVSRAIRLLASVVTGAPWKPRQGFIDAVPFTQYTEPGRLAPVDVVSLEWALLRLMLFSAGLIVVSRAAVRRNDTSTVTASLVVAGSLITALVSLAVMPIGPLGLTPHQMRWLWPVAWFAWMTLILGVLTWGHAARLVTGHRSVWPHYGTRTAVAGIAILAVAGLPGYRQPAGPATGADQIPAIINLGRQLGGLEGRGTVHFDSTNTPFLDNVSAAVMAELQRRRIAFVVDDPGLVRQLGNGRRRQGDEPVRLMLLYDAAAVSTPSGARLEGLVTELSVPDQSDLSALQERSLAGEPLTDDEQARYDSLAASAIGSLAAISYPGRPSAPAPPP